MKCDILPIPAFFVVASTHLVQVEENVKLAHVPEVLVKALHDEVNHLHHAELVLQMDVGQWRVSSGQAQG